MERPQRGDRILILKQPWLGLLLSRQKTLEIRGAALRRGKYFIGYKKVIQAIVILGEPRRIATNEQFALLYDQHKVPGTLPYKKTFGLPVVEIRKCRRVRYTHPRGAIGIVVYRE